MHNLLLPEEESQEQFIADYEDCTKLHKSFANIPFTIPELSTGIIDKIMTGSSDYYLRGMSHLYRHPSVRIIHGMNELQVQEMKILGRAIQSTYN